MVEKKPRKLTKKQRGFVNDYVLTENGTQSALKNYNLNNAKTASVVAVENLGKPSIIEAIEVKRLSLKDALINEGVDEKRIAEKVNVLLNATEETKPDYTAIDKGLKHATAIYGVVQDSDTKPQTNYNFFFNADVQGQVRKIEDNIKNILKNASKNKENN